MYTFSMLAISRHPDIQEHIPYVFPLLSSAKDSVNCNESSHNDDLNDSGEGEIFYLQFAPWMCRPSFTGRQGIVQK